MKSEECLRCTYGSSNFYREIKGKNKDGSWKLGKKWPLEKCYNKK